MRSECIESLCSEDSSNKKALGYIKAVAYFMETLELGYE